MSSEWKTFSELQGKYGVLRKAHYLLGRKATRQSKLLRECNNIMPTCPKCKGNLRTWEKIDENKTIRIGHADNCELAKELGNEK